MTNTTKDIPKDAIKTRLYAKGTWKLESVAHFGGDETGIADMCLLQDKDGKPFIPGASIAGAARSLLAQQCLTWSRYKEGIDKETGGLKRLFGGAGDEDSMSALIVADAVCETDKPVTTVRDGVRIETDTGTALDKAKFDVEVVERDTEFKIELECIIRFSDANIEKELKALFSALLHAFEKGDIRLGARTRRGYGRGKVDSWDTRELQMDKKQDVMAWLSDDVWKYKGDTLTANPLSTDERRFFRIEVDFALRTSLLIRSSSGNTEDPDMVHLYSKNKPVIPGTSFAGAFRHRASLIAYALKWEGSENDADPVCEMFGPIHKQNKERQESKQTELWASRVTIEERIVENVIPQWQDRVAIDRFTGGSLQSALFNQKPVYPCSINAKTETNVRLILTIEEPEEAEIGLLLLTMRDFWFGNATLGGEASNGRGTLQGIKAKLIYKDTDISSDAKEWQITDDEKRLKVEKDDEGFLQCCVGAAQNYKDRPAASRRPENNDKEETNAD